MNDTCILGTGGTFEKAYSPTREIMEFSGDSVIPELLRDAFIMDCDFACLFQIDSLDMTEKHREQIAKWICSSGYSRIIVVHGTSRMVETARYLRPKVVNKVVVLTGALCPYRYSPTEAAANFGGALAASKLLSAGVYICMHGSAFPADRCRKNEQTGFFEMDTGTS